jgi:hypothetical protein
MNSSFPRIVTHLIVELIDFCGHFVPIFALASNDPYSQFRFFSSELNSLPTFLIQSGICKRVHMQGFTMKMGSAVGDPYSQIKHSAQVKKQSSTHKKRHINCVLKLSIENHPLSNLHIGMI